MASCYYLSNGQQTGPVAEEGLVQLIRAGNVSPADMVWCDGMPNWAPAMSVPEIARLLQTQPGVFVPSPPTSAPSGNYAPANVVGYPNYMIPYANASRRRGGTTAVGVISIIWGGLFVVCAGLAAVVLAGLPQGRAAALEPIDRAMPFISLVLHGGLMVSGIGTLMRKPWSKVIVWVITGPLSAMYAYNVIHGLSRHKPLATPAAEGGYYFGLLFTVAVGIIWLSFLIWFYQRPVVKGEFSPGS